MQIDTSQIDDTSRELGFDGTGEQKGRRIKIPSTKTTSTPLELTSRVCCCAILNAAGWIDWREFEARPGQEWAFGCTSPIRLKSACLDVDSFLWTASLRDVSQPLGIVLAYVFFMYGHLYHLVLKNRSSHRTERQFFYEKPPVVNLDRRSWDICCL
jgi:hypothetical protein